MVYIRGGERPECKNCSPSQLFGVLCPDKYAVSEIMGRREKFSGKETFSMRSSCGEIFLGMIARFFLRRILTIDSACEVSSGETSCE